MPIEFQTLEQVAEAMSKFDQDFQERQSVVSTAVLQPFASALALLASELQDVKRPATLPTSESREDRLLQQQPS